MSSLLGSCREMTKELRQVISGHVHGDDVEFQFDNNGGFPQVCLRLSKVVCSEMEDCCEVTPEMRKMKKKMIGRR